VAGKQNHIAGIVGATTWSLLLLYYKQDGDSSHEGEGHDVYGAKLGTTGSRIRNQLRKHNTPEAFTILTCP
jgi:hypothetical protein